ncbi:amino acid adenylation domain-containing protein, partial [Acidobacteriota bacterium]
MDEQERRQLLFDFNRRAGGYPSDKTMVQLFTDQVARTPNQGAVVFAGKELSYKELDKRSSGLTSFLLEQGIARAGLAAIKVERSLEMITGILGILKTGCGYVPLNPRAPEERNAFILNDCDIKLMLTTRSLFAENGESQYPRIETIFIDEIDETAQALNPPNLSSPEGLAYVIYTSGSTGKPKGVPITHANLCQLLQWGYRELAIDLGNRTIQNLSYYFDWSVWEIFITLTTGSALYMAVEEVLINPEACFDFISHNRITILHVTPTQYSYLLGLGKKFESLQYLFIGAEKLIYDLLHQGINSVLPGCRVFNMYGPTEATIISAVLEIDRERYRDYKVLTSVPIGEAVGNNALLVLDKYYRLCPVNVTGELVIAGEGVAAGYLNNPELTGEKFIAFASGGSEPFCKKVPTPPKTFVNNRLYKTGDLVRRLRDGNIEYLGRIDHQVKIRGFRIEPGEIENRLLEHSGVMEAVVIDRETAFNEKYLCVYIVTREAGEESGVPDIQGLKEYLGRTLPDYMIPAYFVFIDRIPLNANGKVDRIALPIPDEAAVGRHYVPPNNPLEEKLVEIWSEVLDVDREKIGIGTGFFEIGGHSLKAIVLISIIHKELDVKLKLTEIFKMQTIRELAAYIEGGVKERFLSIKAVPKKDYYSLSSAQRRLYLLLQMEMESTGYNMPAVMQLSGKADKEKLTGTFKKLILRHESLRTGFTVIDERPVQKIHPPEEIQFEIEYFSKVEVKRAVPEEQEGRGESWVRPPLCSYDEIIDRFVRLFNLSAPPLMRAGLIKEEEQSYILMVDMHHIISDGTSMGVFIKDFMSVYSGKELPSLKIQYKDFTKWQNSDEQKNSLRQQEAFWQEKFSGGIPVLDLPTDYPRPAVQSFAGRTVFFKIDPEATTSLNRVALEQGATLYMVLLSIYNILLSKLSGQDDVIVGAPNAGRRHADLQNIIGMFINTLSMRNFPAGEKTFRDFLQEVKTGTLEAFENQEYQFEDLIEKVQVKRDLSRNPLFDVMFTLQNMEVVDIEILDLKLSSYKYENPTAKFDMTLQVFEVGKHLSCSLEYCTALFKEETILRFIGYFKNIVEWVTRDIDEGIAAIDIMSEAERRQVLYDFNDTGDPYPGD